MAGITFFGGVEMVCVFAGGDGAIVTAGANANHFIVIYIGRCDRLPRCWSNGMTGIAVVTGCDVRITLARCGCTIVATITGAVYLCVIYICWRHWQPVCGKPFMACITKV